MNLGKKKVLDSKRSRGCDETKVKFNNSFQHSMNVCKLSKSPV